MFDNIKKAVNWFEKQDDFGKCMLIFGGSQIVVAILIALREYGIYDATPIVTAVLPYMNIFAKGVLILGVLGIIYVMVVVTFKENQELKT